MEANEDIRLRETGLLGYLVGFLLLVVVQTADGLVLLGQLADGLLHSLEQGFAVWVVIVSGGHGVRMASLALQLVQGQMHGDGGKPRAERILAPVGQSLIGSNERLLSHFLRQFLTVYDGESLRENHSRIATHDFSEALLMAVAQHAIYEFPVCHFVYKTGKRWNYYTQQTKKIAICR